MDSKYRILISNASRTIEIESSDADWLEKKQKELTKYLGMDNIGDKKDVQPTKSVDQKPKKMSPHMSINEYYRQYCREIKANTDLSVYFIYYLNVVEKKKDVNTNHVKELFVRVGIPRANTLNYADILGKAKKRALVNYINGRWSLTFTGEDFVLNKIQSSPKSSK